jgi:hypothetical protein
LAKKWSSRLTDGWPASGLINPRQVRFTQASISPVFRNGEPVVLLAEGLRTGRIRPTDVPAIRVFARAGRLFSLDNRRLWAFREAGVQVPFRRATDQEIEEEQWKFTTRNDGETVRIREPR